MKFKVDEISSVIRQEIENYRSEVDVSEVGKVAGRYPNQRIYGANVQL